MFAQLIIIGVVFIASQSTEFQELPIYRLEDGGTYYLRAEYCTISNSKFTMNGRCWSFKDPDTGIYSTPTSPGPTLKMIAGTTFDIVLENNFINSQQVEEDCHNSYCEMDMLNLHTHGLHISSEQDDVLVDLKPRLPDDPDPNTHTYTYTIAQDHFPGIHWYHPHNHGSVSHQIHFGLFGAIITEYASGDTYPDQSLYTDGGDAAYTTNILVFSSVYAVNTDQCLPCSDNEILSVSQLEGATNEAREGAAAYGRCAVHGKECFHQYSACYEYCAFEGSRETSGFEYYVEIAADANPYDVDGIDQFVLVNGISNPTIEITLNKYRRLQFVNTMHQYFIHYKFPYSENCQLLLLGYDGVFFNESRDLSTFSNELILSPGSRGDLLIKCFAINIYEVVTISLPEESQMSDADFSLLERFGSDQSDAQKVLFTISVVADAGDTIETAPSGFPERPNYLKDLRYVADAEIDSNCACNQFTSNDAECQSTECCIHYNSKEAMVVNGEEFSSADRYLTYLIQDRVYDFVLKTDRHVHHQHVYPFQLQDDIGTNGFIGQSGDFFDTMGAHSYVYVRTYTADFAGYMVLHCHILPHEDEGMMGLFYVLTEAQGSGVVMAPSPDANTIPTSECVNDLYLRQSYSGAPAPTIGGGGGGKGKKGSALLFDFKLYDTDDNIFGGNGIWFILLIIFMCLTLFNTCIICKSQLFGSGSKVVGNKMYGVVVEKDIDEIDEDF